MMTRRETLRLLGAGAATAMLSPALALGQMPERSRPNIVLIFVDDMNYAGPRCYGDRWQVSTPHIDRLAAEGVRFTQAYVTAPTCGPSRAGLMTGRCQTRFGHEFNSPRREGVGLPLTEKTLGDRMKHLGYRTGIIGKWHLGGDEEVGAEYHPLQRGFDEFYGFYGSMVRFYRSNHIFRGREQVKEPEYLTDAIARESCDFIQRHRDQPFFLYTAFNAVHTPLEAPEEDLAAARAIPIPPAQQQRLDRMEAEARDKALNKIITRRAMLMALDRGVGRIMDQLRASGIDDNTLVIFTNDNGDYNSNGPFRGGKGQCAEGGIRVPYIMRWPGKLKAGVTYDPMVSTLDIMPTAIAAAGGAVDAAWQLDGTNLLPHLAGRTDRVPHEWLFWRMGNNKAARHGRWKLYLPGESGYGRATDDDPDWALYDLDQDPAEQTDLSRDRPEQFQALRTAFDAWERQQSKPRWKFGASGQMGRW